MNIRMAICGMAVVFSLTTRADAPPSYSPTDLMAKGDSCRQIFKINQSLTFYEQAYNDVSDEGDPKLRMQLLERIMRTHDLLRHWKEMPEASYRLYMLAQQQDDSVYLSKALFMRGKRLYMQGYKQQGYGTCFHALGIMKRANYKHKYHEMAAFYALLCWMYMGDGMYRTALRMSENEEYCVEKGYVNHDMAWRERAWQRVYYLRIALLAKMGRTAEADQLYRQHIHTANTDPLVGDALLVYYCERQMPEAALQYLENTMQHINDDGDSLGRNMLKLLNDKGHIYYLLGDYQKAGECFANTTRIADSISARSLTNVSGEVQKVMDSERAIARHDQLMVVAVSGLLLLLVVMALMFRYNVMVRRKNKSIMATTHQLIRYRDMVIKSEASDEMTEKRTSDVDQEEFQRFKQMDRRIMKEQLFVQPDFGRDELMNLMGVDKNALATIINKYTGTNVPGYINTKRMEYAVALIKSHPEYTMAAIGEACGIPSATTFIRNFKNVYDMTPSDFRRQLEESDFTLPLEELTLSNIKPV